MHVAAGRSLHIALRLTRNPRTAMHSTQNLTAVRVEHGLALGDDPPGFMVLGFSCCDTRWLRAQARQNSWVAMRYE